MAGGRPVGFIQFADFLPNGINQVISELGTIRWRSGGAFECPAIFMVTCGGYKPGLGPFHAQTFEALLAGVPGVDVFMPSTAADAAGLLNAAFEGGRPTVFLYPKACLNDRGNACGGAIEKLLVSPGTAARRRTGDDLTLVAWGSTVSVAEAVADTLIAAGHTVDLLDLRTITPWDRAAVAASAARTGRLLVVHEDNLTAGFGGEVVAAVCEDVARPLKVKRVARPDVPVPQAFSAQLEVLPSYRRVLDAAASLLGVEADWSAADRSCGGTGDRRRRVRGRGRGLQPRRRRRHRHAVARVRRRPREEGPEHRGPRGRQGRLRAGRARRRRGRRRARRRGRGGAGGHADPPAPPAGGSGRRRRGR